MIKPGIYISNDNFSKIKIYFIDNICYYDDLNHVGIRRSKLGKYGIETVKQHWKLVINKCCTL